MLLFMLSPFKARCVPSDWGNAPPPRPQKLYANGHRELVVRAHFSLSGHAPAKYALAGSGNVAHCIRKTIFGGRVGKSGSSPNRASRCFFGSVVEIRQWVRSTAITSRKGSFQDSPGW